LHCMNPVTDNRMSPLPPLEDLAEGVTAQLVAGLKHGSEPIKNLDKALRESGTYLDWFPGDRHT
jgi:hypothetical protein